MKNAIGHLRANAVAYLALFVALGGTSYAAVSIPRNSVGTKQLRNGAVTSVKLGKGIAGIVRAWAIVAPSGAVIAGGGRPHVIVTTAGHYEIFWQVPIPKACATVANVEQRDALGPTETATTPGGGIGVVAGYASQVETIGGSARSNATTPTTTLLTLNQTGQLAALPFDVAVIC